VNSEPIVGEDKERGEAGVDVIQREVRASPECNCVAHSARSDSP